MLGSVLLLLTLTACSGETPTAPLAQDVSAGEQGKSVEGLNAAEGIQVENPALRGHPEMKNCRFNNPRHIYKTWLTWNSAYCVEKAAKDYADDNDGWFATSISNPNAVGKTLIDYLPAGQFLMNAYTGVRTEPVDEVAAYQGSIGYLVIYDDNAYPVGYTVTAMGRNNSEFLSLEYRTD